LEENTLKIYLTRHGKTIWNNEKRIQGWKDSQLIREGISNAKNLKKRFENIDFDYILSSPLKRAYDTAKILKGERTLEILKKDFLKEINMGDWEGKMFSEIEKEYPEEHNNF
jgi:probable phosphoglycerate mutase